MLNWNSYHFSPVPSTLKVPRAIGSDRWSPFPFPLPPSGGPSVPRFFTSYGLWNVDCSIEDRDPRSDDTSVIIAPLYPSVRATVAPRERPQPIGDRRLIISSLRLPAWFPRDGWGTARARWATGTTSTPHRRGTPLTPPDHRWPPSPDGTANEWIGSVSSGPVPALSQGRFL